MRIQTRPFALFAALIATLLLALPVAAQSQFAPVVQVNDKVITQFEINQRAQLLRLLRAPGDPVTLAREQLIEDRLKTDAGQANGIAAAPEAVRAGMEEFAGRANMSAEQFIRALKGGGVAEQTFRDFVTAGIVWRDLVRAKFGARVEITDAEVDRALSTSGSSQNVRVLLSEVILPASPQQAAAAQNLAAQISGLRSVSAFEAAARKYSASPTRARGGRLEWIEVTKLPPALRPIILGLSVGEVSQPIPLEGAIALFQLRDIQETGRSAPEYSAIDYAAYYIPGGRSADALNRAAGIKSRIDRCDDLYGVAKGQPPEVLERGAKSPAEIPQDVALELAKLDPGEVSTALTRANGQTLVFLMLCSRKTQAGEDASREDITVQLRNQRLTAFADRYLAELRAEARIRP